MRYIKSKNPKSLVFRKIYSLKEIKDYYLGAGYALGLNNQSSKIKFKSQSFCNGFSNKLNYLNVKNRLR